jgi:hypothetical protein
MDLFKPRGSSTPRRPTDNNQKNGVVINTPRFSQFGGLSGPTKAAMNGLRVEKPADGKKVI